MPRECCPYREALFQGRLWSPLMIKPAIWIDASRIDSLTFLESNVTNVKDVVSGISFAVSGTIPFDRTQLGNRPSLRIDNKTVKSYLTASYSYSGNEITLVSLHRNKASSSAFTAYGRLWSLYRPPMPDYNQTDGGILIYGVGGANGVRFYRAINTNVTSSPTIQDTWGCAVLTRTGTSVTMGLDGGSRVSGTTSSANFNFTTLRIGNDDGPRDDSGMDGYIAENYIFLRALSVREEKLLTGYLAWKWGRTKTLPADHPFCNRPPLIGD